MHLIICGLAYSPLLSISDDGKEISGVLADLISFASASLNFTYSFWDFRTEPRVYEQAPNSTFMNLYHVVGQGECDILVMPVDTSYEMKKVVGHSAEIMFSSTVILSGGPVEESVSATWALFVGNPEVIAGFFTLMFVFALILYIMERRVWRSTRFDTTFANIFWNLYGNFFLEPLHIGMIKNSTRIVAAIWLITIVILSSIFGGNLRANIQVGDKKTIDTLEDVLVRPTLQPILSGGNSYDRNMRDSINKAISSVYKQSQRTGGVLPWMDILTKGYIEKIKERKSVVVIPDVGAYILMSIMCTPGQKGIFHLSEEVMEASNLVLMQSLSLPKDFKETFDRKVRFFAATGQTEKPYRDLKRIMTNCYWRADQNYQKSNDLLTLTVIWFGGIGVSFFVLILENIIARLSRCCNK